MKVTDLRRKLIATLAAGGLLAPGVLHAANLNTNLVVNAGFENVDLLTTGGSNGPLILDWTTNGITAGPFAYAHAGGGGQGADYANGGPLSAGGQYYFTANNGTPDFNAPGMIYQDIDVSGGASGTLIQSGNGIYTISASISSYDVQGDLGHVHLDFLNAAQTSLGTVDLTTTNTSTWTTNAKGGAIPATTHTVRVSVYGTTTVNGGPDGYIDNVQFLVSNEPLQPALSLTIDRDNGSMSLANKTGSPVNISGYQITSPFEGLAPANWLSIADNYDQGSPGANQIDSAHQWSELTDPASRADLSEADLASGAGASLAHSKTVNLSSSGAWIRNPNEDVVFKYVSNGLVVNGIVSYVDNGGVSFAQGDLNTDGTINAADWTVLKTNLHTSLTGKSLAEAYRLGDLNQDKANNHADFAAFKTAFDAANGVGAFAAMIASVPEPSSLALAAVVGATGIPIARRRRLQS